MSSKSYIHYGADAFSMEKFEERRQNPHNNRYINKPPYGLWASPIDADLGWKDWCEAEEFHTDRLDKSFTFTLSDNAKILVVTSNDDIKDYISDFDKRVSLFKYLDFDKIMRDYDCMELVHTYGHYDELHGGFFNSWDVDSIVIWNPQIIQCV